ncbi:protein kinase [Chloroflexota bacterium]
MVNDDDAVWMSEQDLQPLSLIGELIAERYEVERLLGQGGMGSVYLATDQLLERQVAIKILKPDIVPRHNPVRFYYEARILARMNHPNIVTLYNCGWYREQAYLVMEYASGKLLSSLINSYGNIHSSLTIAEALKILTKVCDAINYAHEHSVIHRDIKPDNVIVGDDVKLMDFGIAKMCEDDRLPSVISTAEGTPLYCAPEQAMGGDIDERSDIYSLGVVIYEVLTGYPPFSVTGDLSMISQHAYVTPIAPHLRNSSIPEVVSHLIMRMLAKNSESRPDSMSEVLAVLESALMTFAPERNLVIPGRKLPENLDQAKVQALRSIPLLASIAGEDLRDLSKKLSERHFKKGETIFEKEEPGSSLHIIREGNVRIILSMEGRQDITLAYLGAGDFFGEMSLLDDKPRSAAAIAVEPTVTLMLSRGDFLDFLKWFPDAALGMLGVLAQRMRDLNSRLESVLSQDPRKRFAETIRNLMENHGIVTAEGYEIELPLTIRDLAGMSGLGMSRTKQMIRNFKAAGIISSIGRHYTILKPEVLTE